jgi:hypothetical protein
MKLFSKNLRGSAGARSEIVFPALLSLVCSITLLSAQTTNGPGSSTATATSADGVHLDIIHVNAKLNEDTLMEDQLVGDNQQPVWTTQRRFPTTRIYVLPPWQFEVEQWWNGKFNRGESADHVFQTEIEAGLPYRFQLDFYENYDADRSMNIRQDSEAVELRYALANWDKIPLNPTLYGEWKFNADHPDAYELKLLLGEDFGPRWHWGFNLFYEPYVAYPHKTEWGFAQGIGYTLLDNELNVGLEMNFEYTTEREVPITREFGLGPSIQWRPTSNTHFDFVPLFGVTHDAPVVETWLVFGVDFGPGSERDKNQPIAPISTRGR